MQLLLSVLMRTLKEEILADQIKRGDEKAFSQLFDEYYSALCFYSNKLLFDMDLSRSLVQQFFVDFWINRDRLNVKYSLKSYLYHSIRNRTIDYLRKLKKEEEAMKYMVLDSNEPFHDLIEEAEINDRINRGLNSLPERCREIFIMSRFEQMKNKEIATRLNISVKTVEMQISIALKRLRENLRNLSIIQLLIVQFKKK